MFNNRQHNEHNSRLIYQVTSSSQFGFGKNILIASYGL